MSKVCHLCVEQQRLSDPQADKVGIRRAQLSPLELHFRMTSSEMDVCVLQPLLMWCSQCMAAWFDGG